MTEEEKKQKIFAMQCASTQRAMLLHEQGKRAHDSEWPPKGWLAVEDAKTWEERVGARTLNFQEVKVELGLKYMRGQYLAEMRNEAPVTSLDETKRDKAISAFMFIKQTFKDIMEAMGLLQPEKKREFDYAEVIRRDKNEK